jgi:hypothetical protein
MGVEMSFVFLRFSICFAIFIGNRNIGVKDKSGSNSMANTLFDLLD